MNENNQDDVTGIALLDKLFFDANLNRYGIMAILLLVVGCMGGIAVGTGGINSTTQLFLLAFSTMFSLSMMLAVAPMKWVIYSGIIAIVIDLVIIAFNLLS
ncbi:MAG: hypothetical protein N4A35_06280 [Flavobacteriales bacterium]|jgi:hypothetical protein|nr:hypothetical protein [Flavobacteriales bacterium]